MLYLLDANTLIDAEQYYYGFDQVPQFWDWLLARCAAGEIKMPCEIWEEVKGSTTALGTWINDEVTKSALLLGEQPDAGLLNDVLAQGYASDLNDAEIEKIGADPFLAAYALVDSAERLVVTKEVSRPKQTRANRKLPDVCNDLGISWMTDFTLYKILGFKAK